MVEHIFKPPPAEAGRKPTFTKTLQTEANLFQSIPRGPKGSVEPLRLPAGLEVEIEGKSWQQVASQRNPRKYPDDLWVEVTVVSPQSPYRGRKFVVTMGNVNRLKEGQRKEDQPKPRRLTRKAALGRSAEYTQTIKPVTQPAISVSAETPNVETKTGAEETFELRISVGTRLFTEHPRPRLEGETKDQRRKYLDETADWITKGRTAITVTGSRKETWANEDHWISGKITTATRADLYPEDEKIKPLNLGQVVFISKGEASPRRPQKKD